jgi:hypothetical protein
VSSSHIDETIVIRIGNPTVIDSTDNVKVDCFGKVIQHEPHEHKDNPDEGTLI